MTPAFPPAPTCFAPRRVTAPGTRTPPTQRLDGAPMTLQLPLRTPTAVTAGVVIRRAHHHRHRRGHRRFSRAGRARRRLRKPRSRDRSPSHPRRQSAGGRRHSGALELHRWSGAIGRRTAHGRGGAVQVRGPRDGDERPAGGLRRNRDDAALSTGSDADGPGGVDDRTPDLDICETAASSPSSEGSAHCPCPPEASSSRSRWFCPITGRRSGPCGRTRRVCGVSAYRFRRSCGDLRYSFRARLPAESAYPFEDGNTDPVGVRVRGARCR